MSSEQSSGKFALVTGANRGIGFEICRQLGQRGITVLLGARDAEKAADAARQLTDEGFTVHPITLDVASEESVKDAAAHIAQEFGRLDVLVNNAGGGFDMFEMTSTTSLDAVKEIWETNLFGSWRICQAFLPLVRKSAAGRIVNVSSEAGSFGSEYGLGSKGYGSSGGSLPAYGISKAALNALSLKLAAELKEVGILVNAVCPGFTATHPGTAEMGARPVAEGAAGIVWAATLPDNGPTGGFFRDGKPLPW